MNNDEYQEFVELWTATQKLYSNAEPSNMTCELAFDALKGYPLGSIKQALSAHVQSPDAGVYPPKPADIVRHLQGTGGERGQHAWSKVERAIRCVGQYQSVCFDDPLIHVIIREMGGWPQLALVSGHEIGYKGHEFITRYTALARSGVTQWPSYLPGIAERDCRAMDQDEFVPEPVLIGEPEHAKAVLEQGGRGDQIQITAADAAQQLISSEGE